MEYTFIAIPTDTASNEPTSNRQTLACRVRPLEARSARKPRLVNAPRRRAFLITQANFSDIGQHYWDLTRPGGPKSESVGGIQSVGSSKPNRFPPGAPFKPLFQGQTYLATYTKTGLILLILSGSVYLGLPAGF